MLKKFSMKGTFDFSDKDFMYYPNEAYTRLVKMIYETSSRFEKAYGFRPNDLYLNDKSIGLVCKVNNVNYKMQGEDQFFLGYRILLYPTKGTDFYLTGDCDFINYDEIGG